MIEKPFGELGLPETDVPEPAGAQVKLDLKREGTLVWMLQQMANEAHDYGLNILGADLKNQELLSQVIDWQARKQVLEQWLERLITLVEGADNGD